MGSQPVTHLSLRIETAVSWLFRFLETIHWQDSIPSDPSLQVPDMENDRDDGDIVAGKTERLSWVRIYRNY